MKIFHITSSSSSSSTTVPIYNDDVSGSIFAVKLATLLRSRKAFSRSLDDIKSNFF